ncbi:hypothetical protein Bbelb_131560 [Branchiostoma belcheri]|nr:hypothetical protein Bbelb_131560 [Branchiostoma belcheri]
MLSLNLMLTDVCSRQLKQPSAVPQPWELTRPVSTNPKILPLRPMHTKTGLQKEAKWMVSQPYKEESKNFHFLVSAPFHTIKNVLPGNDPEFDLLPRILPYPRVQLVRQIDPPDWPLRGTSQKWSHFTQNLGSCQCWQGS